MNAGYHADGAAIFVLTDNYLRIFMINSKLHFFFTVFISLLLLAPSDPAAQIDPGVDEKRNKLIGYMLGKQLPSIHYSDKQVNDDLAEAAFDLYLKQLDFPETFSARGRR